MNPVIHFEMPFDDGSRMANFYGTAFGWQTQALGQDMGGYVLATTTDSDGGRPKAPGTINGGFFPRKPDWPAQHPSVVIAVDDIEESARKVTKAGGKVALAVWHKSEINPFCYTVTNVMAQHVASPAVDPDAPNAFRFAESGKLANVLTAAGASEVEESVVSFDIEAPLSPLQFWTMRSHTSDTLREKLAKLSSDEQAQIAGEMEQTVKEFFPDNQMKFPAQMILVTGTA